MQIKKNRKDNVLSSLLLLEHAAKFFEVDLSRFVVVKFCEGIFDLKYLQDPC